MILGFGHKARTGKTTCTSFLSRTLGFVEESYANSLKLGIGRSVFGLSDRQMDDQKEIIDPFWNLTPRQILQKAGTDAMRTIFGEDIWVKTLERRINLNPKDNYAIMDVRFPNEGDAIKKMGGYVINVQREIVGTTSQHISETAMNDYKYDYAVDNNSTFEHLHNQLRTIVFEILHKGQ